MSVSSRSPITSGRSASDARRGRTNSGANGLPTISGSAPVVVVITASSAPAPGHRAPATGNEPSGFVATRRAPRSTSSHAVASLRVGHGEVDADDDVVDRSAFAVSDLRSRRRRAPAGYPPRRSRTPSRPAPRADRQSRAQTSRSPRREPRPRWPWSLSATCSGVREELFVRNTSRAPARERGHHSDRVDHRVRRHGRGRRRGRTAGRRSGRRASTPWCRGGDHPSSRASARR